MHACTGLKQRLASWLALRLALRLSAYPCGWLQRPPTDGVCALPLRCGRQSTALGHPCNCPAIGWQLRQAPTAGVCDWRIKGRFTFHYIVATLFYDSSVLQWTIKSVTKTVTIGSRKLLWLRTTTSRSTEMISITSLP